MTPQTDARWLAAAAALAERARPLSRPNPAVGALIVKSGIVIGRGWTRPGGRPHAEAVALGQAGDAARGATLYVTLEPCAHASERGRACAEIIAEAGLARVVAGVQDPDPRTARAGMARLRKAGIEAVCLDDEVCCIRLAGYNRSKMTGFPEVTLQLAMTADGALRPDLLVGRVIGLGDAPAALAALDHPPTHAGMTVIDPGRSG